MYSINRLTQETEKTLKIDGKQISNIADAVPSVGEVRDKDIIENLAETFDNFADVSDKTANEGTNAFKDVLEQRREDIVAEIDEYLAETLEEVPQGRQDLVKNNDQIAEVEIYEQVEVEIQQVTKAGKELCNDQVELEVEVNEGIRREEVEVEVQVESEEFACAVVVSIKWMILVTRERRTYQR